MGKKITLNHFELQRIYEWRLALNQLLGKSCCSHCTELERRIKKAIGIRSSRLLKRLIKKHPYLKQL